MYSGQGCFGIPQGTVIQPAFFASNWAATPTTAGATAAPAVIFDRLGNYDGSTFRSPKPGLYIFTGAVSWADTSPTTRTLIAIKVNGITVAAFQGHNVAYSGGEITAPLLLKKNDKVTLFIQPIDTAATTVSVYFGGWFQND